MGTEEEARSDGAWEPRRSSGWANTHHYPETLPSTSMCLWIWVIGGEIIRGARGKTKEPPRQDKETQLMPSPVNLSPRAKERRPNGLFG